MRCIPLLAFHIWRSKRQIQGVPGFLGGYLATGPKLALWTVTVWTDEGAMRAYRDAAPHRKAMPRLIGLCDEAAVVHWTGEGAAPPAPAEAAERMKQGRTSKVRHPSPAHAAGETWPDGKVPSMGPRLRP